MRQLLCGTPVRWHILAILLLAAGTAAAQERDLRSPDAAAPILYRRVYTPQTDLDKYTRGYLPMLRRKFPEFLERIESRRREARTDAAWIQSADYSAVFSDGQLTSGLAQLNVVHTSVEPSVLVLSPCQLAVGVATWQGAEMAKDALVGNDLAGNLIALVRDSGQLHFRWTLHGETNSWDETRFDVILAPSPMNRLSVDLPPGYQLLSSRGIVTQLDQTDDDPTEELARRSRQWVVQLGGAHRFLLTVASQYAMRQRKQLVSLQQDTLYRVTDDGLEMDCDVAIEIQREPLEVLLFRVDAELQVTSVRLGNREIDWSLDSEPDGQTRQLRVRFAEPLSGIHRTLQISAIGPLQLGSKWRLPQFHGEHTFWRQGTMALLLSESLGLRHLAAIDARQSKSSSAGGTSAPPVRRFELFSDNGYLEVNVVRNTPKLTGTVGTTVHLESDTMTALIVAEFSCVTGEHYVLEADVPNTWTLDGIESKPPEVLADHQFVAYQAKHKRLQIRLAQPLAADSPLRLSIRAHRTPTFDLRADGFRPIEFRNLAKVTRVVAIAPVPGLHLNLGGDAEVSRLDPTALPPSQANLLQPRSGGIVFLDGQQADLMTIKVTREDPTLTADNHVSVETTADTLTESYRLVCTPESTSISRVLVLFSEARTEPIRWSLQADGNKLLSATMLPRPAGQGAPYNQTGQVWELLLRNPQDKPFEIRGTRETTFRAAKQISLVTLPDATSQEGWLTILSRDGTPLSIKASSAKPIPTVPRDPEQSSTARARYRYDVSRNARVLIDHVRPQTVQAPLWAWCCRLRSQLLADGEMTHQATYLLESAGGNEFHFRLPSNAVLRSVEIDGAPGARQGQVEPNGSHTVTLPADARFSRVVVSYATPQNSFRLWRHVAAQVPTVDIPVIDQQWTLWLAPGLSPMRRTLIGNEATWSSRLLGPLATRPSERPFQIFSADQWAALVARDAETRNAVAVGQRFLQLLGEQVAALQADSSDAGVTWRMLLQSYDQQEAKATSVPPVWVDSCNLLASGFVLDHELARSRQDSPEQTAARLLAAENLVAVARGDSVTLTSLDHLAQWPASICVAHDSAMATVATDSVLAKRLDALARWPDDEIIPLRAWIALPAVAQVPWQQGDHLSRRGVAGRYWQAYEIALNRRGQGQYAVVHSPTLAALSWATLLIATGFASWVGARRPRFLLSLIACTAIFAMLVPVTWIPLTANLFLGAVLASCLLMVRHVAAGHTSRREAAVGDPATTGIAAMVGFFVFATMLLFATQSLWADDHLPAKGTSEAAHVYNVIVPIDDKLNPVGDYDYLPTELYDFLHHRAEGSDATPQRWLVRRATYHATFNWTRQHSAIDLTSLTALYQLELFQPQQRIAFPWTGDDPAVQILEARLAGQPIELIWNNDRTAFFITVPDEGVTRLEFVLLPTTADEAGTRTMKFSIPPLSRAQLRIEKPFDAPDIEVLAAFGEAGIVAEAGERLVELGPVPSLGMRWAAGQEQRVGRRQLDVQQLNWLKLRPKDHLDSVILDVKLRIQPSGDTLQQVVLRADPRLRLLPTKDNHDVEIRTSGAGDGSPVTLTVRLRQPIEQDLLLHLQFWIVNTAGLGNVSLPRLEVMGARVARRWLAVSVAPDLDFTPGLSELLNPMETSEFLTAWGEAELAPNLCYRMEADDPMWSIGTRAREPRSEAQQRLDISVGPDSMNLVLNADVETTRGTIFQHDFAVSKSFRVHDVTVTVDGEAIPAEADHDGSGLLTLFLGRGVSGPHHIELHGQQDVPAIDKDFSVPEVALRNMISSERFVRVFRQVSVLVSVNVPAPNTFRQRVGVGQYSQTFGRLVAAFNAHEKLGPDDQRVTLRVTPNRPSVHARLVTTLQRMDDTWEAIVDYGAWINNAPAGVIDQIRFEIPEEWIEPFVVEPAMPYEVRPIPGRRRQLILRPTKPVTDRFHVTIRGTLALGTNERGRTPNIVPLDVNRAERFFVLPTQLDQQRIDWKTSGLRLVSLRDALPNVRADVRGLVAYAVYSRPRAVIVDVQRVAGERQIDLADVHLICRPNGTCFGTVTLDLEPAGAANCTLEIPRHCELIQAAVEGDPAALVPLADRRWHLRLASEQLPQQLVLTFRTQLPGLLESVATPIQVPWITDFKVARTLWTIHGPPGIGLDNQQAAQHQVTAAVQESIRLRTTAILVESTVETVLDSSATEIEAWYQPWAIRLACSAARLARDRQRTDAQPPISPAEVERIFRKQLVVGQRLNVPLTVDELRQRTVHYAQPSDMMRFMQRCNEEIRRYEFTGDARAVSIVAGASPQTTWLRQALGALTVGLLGGLAWWGSRNARVVEWLYQWPYAVGVLAGLFWWLFAWPSWFGWVIIAMSLWGTMRLPLPSQPGPSQPGPNQSGHDASADAVSETSS